MIPNKCQECLSLNQDNLWHCVWAEETSRRSPYEFVSHLTHKEFNDYNIEIDTVRQLELKILSKYNKLASDALSKPVTVVALMERIENHHLDIQQRKDQLQAKIEALDATQLQLLVDIFLK